MERGAQSTQTAQAEKTEKMPLLWYRECKVNVRRSFAAKISSVELVWHGASVYVVSYAIKQYNTLSSLAKLYGCCCFVRVPKKNVPHTHTIPVAQSKQINTLTPTQGQEKSHTAEAMVMAMSSSERDPPHFSSVLYDSTTKADGFSFRSRSRLPASTIITKPLNALHFYSIWCFAVVATVCVCMCVCVNVIYFHFIFYIRGKRNH